MTLILGAKIPQLEAAAEKRIIAQGDAIDTRLVRAIVQEDLTQQSLAKRLIGKYQAVTPGPNTAVKITPYGDSLVVQLTKPDGRKTHQSYSVEARRKATTTPDGDMSLVESGRLDESTVGQRKTLIPEGLIETMLQSWFGFKNVKETSISAREADQLEIRSVLKSEAFGANEVSTQTFKRIG